MATVLNRKEIWKRIGYKPHSDEQLLIHNSKARFKVPACGRRFGKSKAAAAEALTNPLYNLFMPNIRGWIVGPKYILGEKEFRYIWNFFIRKLKLGSKCKKAYNVQQGNMYIELPWGSRVDVMSAQHKDTLVGEGLHFLIVAESAKQDSITWDQYLRATLNDYRGWAIFPSTPQGYNHYYNLHQLGDVTSEHYTPEYESWNFPSWTNKVLYPGGRDDPEIQAMEREMPEDVFWQEIGASFRRTVGLIYPEWEPEEHIIEAWAYRPEWPNYLFFDFGFTNPFVALDVQISPMDDVIVWRERYVSKMTIGRHIHEMKARPQPLGYKIECGFGDSADPGAVEEISSNLCPTYADPDAKSDWVRGVREVKRFLHGEDRLAHLQVSKDCPNTIWEFQNYRMKPSSGPDKNTAEAAHQYRDHAMDAIRYGLMHLYVLGAGRYSLKDVVDIEDFLEDEDKGIFTRGEGSEFTMGQAPRW